ncbi:MAG: PD-(D/E)XK nuclease family protein [Ktedonobacterales bacterium]
MQVTTTRRDGSAVVKSFSWSYSKLKNYETCPKRHWHVDIQRDVKEEESENLVWGNQVHKALAERISKGMALPDGMGQYEGWCQKFLSGEGSIDVEQKLAINSSFMPVRWFDNDAWYRAVCDVIKVNGVVALVADWKTGKILEDSQQLALAAACVFAHYPSVMRIRSEFIWLKEDASSRADFKRETMPDMWRALWPRIEQLKVAHEQQDYPAKPGRICRSWCPVKQCPHNGESF